MGSVQLRDGPDGSVHRKEAVRLPKYEIFIKNFRDQNGNVITADTKMYEIPISSPEDALTDPVVTTEMGKAGSFEASIKPDQTYYNCWLQMKTIVRVEYDDVNIFRGRALTVDDGLMGDKKLHFEGDLAFLLDSQQEPSKEEERPVLTLWQYVAEQILSSHNAQMREQGDGDKEILPGELPGNYSGNISQAMRIPNERGRFGSDGWQTSMDALEELQKVYGGYFRTRYTGGYCYLDWLDSWFNEEINTQPIEIGENLIDMNSSAEVENIFTALIPIGRNEGNDVYVDGYRTDINGTGNKRILVPTIVNCFSTAELSLGYHTPSDYASAVQKYGIIYKTQTFENADTKEKLWDYAVDWIRLNYIGGIVGFTLTAVDLKHLDDNIQKHLTGDRLRLTYPDLNNRRDGVTPMVTRNLTITAITYNLHHPESNSYTVGTPNNILTRTYGSPVTKAQPATTSATPTTTPTSSSSASSQAAAAATQASAASYSSGNFEKETEKNFWEFLMNPEYNTAEYNAYVEKYGSEAGEAAIRSAYILLDDAVNKTGETKKKAVEEVQHIVLDAHFGVITGYDPPEWQQSEIIPGENEANMKAYFKQLEEQQATRSMVINVIDRTMEVKEKVDLVGAQKYNWLDEYETPKLPSLRNLVEFQAKDTNSSGYTRYLARNVLKSIDEGGLPNPSEPVDSILINSKNGQFAGAKTTLGPMGDIITQMENGDVEGGVTLDGILATIGVTSDNSTLTNLLDGKNGLFEMFDPSSGSLKGLIDGAKSKFSLFKGLGSGSDSDETVKIDGSTGRQFVGKDANGDWQVLLNDTVTHKDKDGNTVTTSGMVTAKDFKIEQQYDSVGAQLGIFDRLIANKIDAAEIYADYLSAQEIAAVYASFDDLVASNIAVVSGEYNDAQAWLEANAGDISDTAALLAEKIVAYEGRFRTIEADYLRTIDLQADIADLQYVGVRALSSSGAIETSTSVYAQNFYFGSSESGNPISVANFFYRAEIVPPSSGSNEYTLRMARMGQDWEIIGTFSRATTLTGTWSGSTYRVTASPQTDAYVEITPVLQHNGNEQYDNFSVELWAVDSSGNNAVRDTIRSYMKLVGEKEQAKVKIFDNSAGTGTAWASLAVGDLYTQGKNSAQITDTQASWNNGVYTVRVKIGDSSSYTRVASTTLDSAGWAKVGNPTWAADYSSVKQDIAVNDSDGNTAVILDDVTFYTTSALTAGKNAVTLDGGSWNGRTFTVKTVGRPSVLSASGIVYDGLVPSGSSEYYKSGSNHYVRQTMNVYSDDGEGDADRLILSKSVSILANGAYAEGVADGRESAEITDVDAGWNNETYTVRVKIGSGSYQTIASTYLPGTWTKVGNPSWADDYTYVEQDIIVDDEDGNTAVTLPGVWFDTSRAVSEGIKYGKQEVGLSNGSWDGNGTYTVSTTGKSPNLERSTSIKISSDGNAEPSSLGALFAMQPYAVYTDDEEENLVKAGSMLVSLSDVFEQATVYVRDGYEVVVKANSGTRIAGTNIGQVHYVSGDTYEMRSVSEVGELVTVMPYKRADVTAIGDVVRFRDTGFTGRVYDENGGVVGTGHIFIEAFTHGANIYTYYRNGGTMTRYVPDTDSGAQSYYTRKEAVTLYERKSGSGTPLYEAASTYVGYHDTPVSLWYSKKDSTSYFQRKS